MTLEKIPPFIDPISIAKNEEAETSADSIGFKRIKYWYDHGGFAYEEFQVKINDTWEKIPVINLVKQKKIK